MGSSRLPVVFSNTFVSCPHGREEVGLVVLSPGGLFLPPTYGCECDWPAMQDPPSLVTQHCEAALPHV